MTGTVRADQYAFLITSRSFLLRMRNVSDKSCTENQNTHFVFSNIFFRKSYRLCDNVEKYCKARDRAQMAIRRMRIECWIPKATETHTEHVTRYTFCTSVSCLPVVLC